MAASPRTELALNTRAEESILYNALRKLVRHELSRTEALRGYAEAIVALRLTLAEQAGIDLAAVPRSAPYREAVSRVYERAGLSNETIPGEVSRAALGASIRYHVAEVFRERGMAEEAGVNPASPTERLRTAREVLAERRAQPPAPDNLPDLFAGTMSWLAEAETLLNEGAKAPHLTEQLDALLAEVHRLRRLARQRQR